MSFFNPQNPGIGGLDELTDSELLFLQNLVTLPYENGDILYYNNGLQRLPKGTDGEVIKLVSGLPVWDEDAGGSGTVTSLSVVTANGFAGTVADPTTTPAITLRTSVTGILQGNGTAISAATTTGTGSVVLNTAPTFATSITTPLIIGGTSTTSSLTYKTTTGVGTTGADHIFLVGNDGATEAMRILNNGNIGIRNNNPQTALDVTGVIWQRTTTAANTNNYLNVNKNNAASSTLLNSGVLLYASGADEYGLDLGHNGVTYRTRLFTPASGAISFARGSGSAATAQSSFTDIMSIEGNDNIILGKREVLATTATAGFVYIPTSAGQPTGTPISYTGKVATEIDTTNNEPMFYNSGWKNSGISVSKLNKGLIQHMPLDFATFQHISNAGGVLDIGPVRNAGQNFGATFNPTGGPDGTGEFVFDGTDDYISIPHNVNQLLVNGFTLSAWIRPDSYGGADTGDIIDKSNSSALGVDGFSYDLRGVGGDNCVRFVINNGTPRLSATGSIIPDGTTWYHVLVTVASDATVTHYINGVVSGTPGTTGALSGITTGKTLKIGNRNDATDRSFDGGIAKVRMYSRVLSTAEITALYNGQL